MAYKFDKYDFVVLSEEQQKTFSEKNVENSIVYIDDEQMWLKCPCGCDETYKLNTHKNIKPKWQFVPPNSISPSVNHTAGCMSHFTITNGVPMKN